MIPVIKTVSGQTADVYRLLNDGGELSAQQIADALHILPNAVYRVAKKLVELGMIEQTADYPVRYKAVPPHAAQSMYLLAASHNFRREFGIAPTGQDGGKGPVINLIKDRPALLSRQQADIRAARQSIDFIVSGHDVPEETMLSFRKATTVGVKTRMIIHQKGQANRKQADLWKDLGVEVRFLSGFELRLFVFDKQITYITSYDSSKPNSAFGVRFAYEPLAIQMSELFEQNWQKAGPL